MVTSGVSNFDPTFEDILQDAAAMVGGGPLLADELISARRGLDYLLTDLQNRNVLLHKIETTVVPVSASVSALTFGPSISDVLTATVRTSTTEMVMDRDGYERWAEIPTKSVTGRPIRYWWDRRRNSNVMNLWPLPDRPTTSSLQSKRSLKIRCELSTISMCLVGSSLPSLTASPTGLVCAVDLEPMPTV